MERAGASLLSFALLAFLVHFCYFLYPASKLPAYMVKAAKERPTSLRREIHTFPLPIVLCAPSHSNSLPLPLRSFCEGER